MVSVVAGLSAVPVCGNTPAQMGPPGPGCTTRVVNSLVTVHMNLEGKVDAAKVLRD